jgi:hypothetical protein
VGDAAIARVSLTENSDSGEPSTTTSEGFAAKHRIGGRRIAGMLEQSHAPIDRLTVIAIGIVSGLLLLVTHEVFGHSVVTLALGERLVHLTNVDSSFAGAASPLVMRLIAAAGIVANIVFGCIALSIVRIFTGRARTLGYFFWLYGHATLFMGSAYLAGFAFLPFGDVRAATEGLPGAPFIHAVFVVAGVAIYWLTLRDATKTLAIWNGGDPAIGRALTIVPYLAMGITNTAAGLFNPMGPLNGALWAAAATFGANAGLLSAASDDPGPATTTSRFTVARSPVWIASGAVAAAILFFILGPGVPR